MASLKERYRSEYNTWIAMINRCYSPNNPRYYTYGGRGIDICKQWRSSFVAFLNDMGPRPFPKAQIDRINNDEGYTLENCRWTTCTENNRRTTRIKLSLEKAREIRALYATGDYTHRSLALLFNVRHASIGFVLRNEGWKENVD